MSRSICAMAALLAFWVPSTFAAGAVYKIGSYYFPGWTDGAEGLEYKVPWAPIKSYPDREPMLGWYRDSDPNVMSQQIAWMVQFGLQFVVFDWYWGGKRPLLEHAVTAFKQIERPAGFKYSLLWADNYKFPGGRDEFREMVRYWTEYHFSDPAFLRIDDQPVVFVFSLDNLEEVARSMKTSSADLIGEARQVARGAGNSGIYFVGATQALAHWVKRIAPQSGMSALSAYNYHQGYSGTPESGGAPSRSFAELDAGYQRSWKWIVENSSLPYIVPMTSGWDSRPWSARKDDPHDRSSSTPSEFEGHLMAAKRLMDAYPKKTLRMGVICCWNEHGEGSVIEPTKKFGTWYLEAVKAVFAGDEGVGAKANQKVRNQKRRNR